MPGVFHTSGGLCELFRINKPAGLFQKFPDTRKQSRHSLMGGTKQLLLKICLMLGMDLEGFQQTVHNGSCIFTKVLHRLEDGCGTGFKNFLLACIQAER